MAEYGYVESVDADYATAAAGASLFANAQSPPNSFGGRIGQYFSGIYQSWLFYTCFDTTNVVGGNDSAYVFFREFGIQNIGSGMVIHCAAYDYGSTLEDTDWLDPTDLAGLTILGSLDMDALLAAQPTASLFPSPIMEIDLAGVNVGGITRLVFFTDNQLTETAPVGGEYVESIGSVTLFVKKDYVDPGGEVEQWPNAALDDTPELLYSLSELSGTVMEDSSGNGHDGTYTDSPSLGETLGFSASDPGVKFDNTGSSSYGSSDDFIYAERDFPGGFTQEILFQWYDPDHEYTGSEYWLTGFGYFDNDSTETDWEFYTQEENWPAFFDAGYENSTGFFQYVSFPLLEGFGGIYHLVWVCDPSAVMHTCYLNGDRWQGIRDANVDGTPLFFGDENRWFVGGDGFDADSHEGIISESAFYDAPLSEERVIEHYRAATSNAPVTAVEVDIIEMTITGLDPDIGPDASGNQTVLAQTIATAIQMYAPNIFPVQYEEIALAIQMHRPLIQYGICVDAETTSGTLFNANSNFSLAISGGGGGLSLTSGSIVFTASYNLSGGTYFMYQNFLEFDTSVVDGGVTDAVLKLHLDNYSDNGTPYQLQVAAFDFGTLTATPPPSASADWRDPSQLQALTVLGGIDSTDLALLSNGDEFQIPLDVSAINPGGLTRLIVFNSRHRDGLAPPANFSNMGFTGYGDPDGPELCISYTPGFMQVPGNTIEMAFVIDTPLVTSGTVTVSPPTIPLAFTIDDVVVSTGSDDANISPDTIMLSFTINGVRVEVRQRRAVVRADGVLGSGTRIHVADNVVSLRGVFG